MMINVVGFVKHRGESILTPVIVKLAFFTVMITLAMILVFSTEKWIGMVVYIKECVEFALFIFYLKRRYRR